MLVEISCSRFRKNPIPFEAGLNVVLGDDQGSNSIGKSTLLMLVDFAHGGNDLLGRSPEVVQNLGDHEYQFTFLFRGNKYVFVRRTDRPSSALAVSVGAGEPREWSVAEYTAWLKQQYGIEGAHITFREAVSPQTRVWKRETLLAEHPLQAFNGEAQIKAVDRLLMLFGAYDALKDIEQQVEAIAADKKNLANAQKSKFITSINKREYDQNKVSIRVADAEIEHLRKDAATLALNIRELVNVQALEASLEKDRLLKIKLQLMARLQQTKMNLDGVGAPQRQAFEALSEFFPHVNLNRLAKVEGFHRELAQVLGRELEDERVKLDEQLALIDGQIAELDKKISPAATAVPSPGFLVDRVIGIAAEAYKRRQANEFYDKKQELAQKLRDLREVQNARRALQLQRMRTAVNEHIRGSAEASFPAGRRPPQLELSSDKYAYDVDQDTGTGTTFAAVVLLDLALLDLTSLPYVIHDSVLLKNIEVPVMAALVRLYGAVRPPKQVFIAIDEALKYGTEAHTELVNHAVVELSQGKLLYDLDWRSQKP